MNQSEGILVNNVAEISFTSPSRQNVITATVDNQSLQFNTNSIIFSINAQKLQGIIDAAADGDIIDLSNFICENISNIIINKSLSFVGNNQTIIKSSGNLESSSGNALFIVDKSRSDVNSLSISNVKFLVDNGDIVLLVNASNSTNPLEIDIPAINITDVAVDKLNGNLIGKTVSLLMVNSQRGLLATSNPINMENLDLYEGIKPFSFNVTGIETDGNIAIPKGGSIIDNGSDNNGSSPISKIVTVIVAGNMKTTAVNTAINGKNAGKTFSITLKDSNGNLLSDKEVLISFDGKVYNVKTDAKGLASVKLALSKKGTYPVVVSFLGDEKYNGTFAVAKIVVNPQKVKLTVAKKKFKSSKKTKYLLATLKSSNKKAIKGKKLTFTVNGKKYTGKTNKKGIAKVKIKLSKKGTYKFTVSFAGDNTFAKISKKGKLIIK